MKSYYEKNYNAFLDRNKNYGYIDDDKEVGGNCFVTKDLKGNELIGVKCHGRDWYMGSRYDNQYFVNKWVEDVVVNNYNAIIFVFGLGEPECIRKLIEKYPENMIMIYEPNISFLKSLMEIYDLTDIILNKKIHITAGEKGLQFLSSLCFYYFDVTNRDHCVFKKMPQYSRLYKVERIKWELVIQENNVKLIADKNSMRLFGREKLQNELDNIYYAAKNNSMRVVADEIMNTGLDTAVLVSAGPSLEKNINLLRNVKGKALILAVDTAVKPVLKIGVRPDITITVDPHKPIELFIYNDKLIDIPMVVNMHSNNKIIRDYEGKMFFSYDFSALFARFYEKDDYCSIILNTGGSVANDGFSFLVEAGIKKIILIGQDLAYPEKKTHISTAYEDEQKIQLDTDKKYFDIEDVYGNMVSTEENMNIYRKWFETAIKNNPQLTVIDATEGGAKIKGTRIMTFCDAIDEFVDKLPFADYESVIENIPNISNDIIEKRVEKMLELDTEMDESKNKIKKILVLYDELDKLNREGKHASETFRRLINEIEEGSDEIEKSVLGILMMYVQDNADYEVLNEIYTNKASVYEEVKLVIDSGRKVLNGYLDKYDEIYEKVRKMVANVKEACCS